MKQYEFIKQLRNLDDQWLKENQDIYKNYLNYIWVKFLTFPEILKYLNKYINDFSWSSFSPYEKAKFIQNIMSEWDIEHWQLWNEWPDQECKKRAELKKELRKKFDSHDIDGLWFLSQHGIIELETSMPQKVKKLSKEEKEKIIKMAQDTAPTGTNTNSTDHFIKELSQEIIDQEKLTLIDAKVLKSKNKILYIFIDKNFHKKFYEIPFEYKFYFDTRNNIVDKEYFENKDSEFMYPYKINNYKWYQQLRAKINENFKREINLGESDDANF